MRAHLGSVLPIKNVPVPLDNNTYTYMNFNKNLVGTINPTYPIINHNKTNINEDSFDEIMVGGKHGQGISIDEYTENKIASIDFEGGWTLYSSTPGETSFRNDTLYGKVIRLYKTDNTSGRYGRSGYISGATGPVYAYSAYVRPLSTTGRLCLYLDAQKTGGGLLTGATYVNLNELTIGEWTKITALRDGGTETLAGGGSIYVWMDGNAGDCEFALPQVELKLYSTKFIEKKRLPTYLSYSINTNPKTISFWFKSNSSKEATRDNQRTLLLLGDEYGIENTLYLECLLLPSNHIRMSNSTNKVGLEARIGNNYYYCKVDSVEGADGEWHHVTVEINRDNKVILWVDGQRAESLSYPSETNFGSMLKVGHSYIPGSESQVYTGLANCTFDDLCIRTAHYEEDEVLQWYHSNREFYNPYDYSYTV